MATGKHTHVRNAPASVGLTQARPNQRLFSEVSDHSTQVAWHVAEQSSSLYSLQKCL